MTRKFVKRSKFFFSYSFFVAFCNCSVVNSNCEVVYQIDQNLEGVENLKKFLSMKTKEILIPGGTIRVRNHHVLYKMNALKCRTLTTKMLL